MFNPPKKKLQTASPPEILRSHQRDNEFVTGISETVIDLLHRYNLHRYFSRYLKPDVAAKMLYFIVTSGFGNQTLGEEYTGIVQANLEKRKIPSTLTRLLSAILECFGEQTLLMLLDKLQIKINKSTNKLTPQAKLFFNTIINRLRTALPILILAHRGLFYIYGKYYSIGRRLTGIDYVKVYGSRPHSSINWGLRVLGIISVAQCLFRFWQTRNLTEEVVSDDKELDGTSSGRCQLCLEKFSDAATPCGHLFCWTCLAEWLRARNRCPLCRETVASSRIVPLMNL